MVAEIRRNSSLGDKPVCKSSRLFLIGTSLLLLAGIRCAQAGDIMIVSPGDYKFIEGERGVTEDCCGPFRLQHVFPAPDFAALGNKPHLIVDWSIRPDHSLTSSRTVHFPDNEVRLSTTQRGPDNLSLLFDDNLGSDVMQFYRGPHTLVADIDGPSPGPREFYDVDHPAGVTPYLYDPSQGNLLLDWIGWLGATPSPRGDLVPGNIQTELAGSPFATRGVLIPALVYQFTFIPVTPGDYNASGAVEQGDLDLVLLNWGNQLTDPAGAGWVTHLPTGPVDQSELDTVLLNWGSSVAFTTAAVPEPSSLALLAVMLVLGSLCRRATTTKSVSDRLHHRA
jgi:hypothetical protein